MDKKIKKMILKDLDILKEIMEFLLKVSTPDLNDFQFCVRKLNSLENDIFFLKNIYDIDTISLLKKTFSIIDRNKNTYYEYKKNLFMCLNELKNLYINYLENGINENEKNIEKIENKIHILSNNISNILNQKNLNKNYYYIKITLNKNIPFFYLSRRTILLNLLEYGNPYNYTPDILDDDTYEYFILDYKADKSINVEKIFKNFKKNDDAIEKYELFEININHNLYNLKFYINDDINKNTCLLMPNFKFLEIIHYRNYYDTYAESKNQRYILETLLKIEDKNITLVTLKKFSDKEVRIFLPAGINSKNIMKVKKIISSILIDKSISEILYSGKVDFLGIQMLEYLSKKYNIEFANVL